MTDPCSRRGIEDLWERSAQEILETTQEMYQQGLVVATWGNVSTRIKGIEDNLSDNLSQNIMKEPELVGPCKHIVQDQVLITPSGMDYRKLKKDDLVLMNLDGVIIQGQCRPSTETPLHLAIYRQRPEVRAIVHTHSLFASVLATSMLPLPPVLEELAQIVGGSVSVAEYALAGTEILADNTLKALEKKSAVLLANHGLVGVGKSLKEALLVCKVVEKGAQVYVYSRMLGQPRILTESEINELRNKFLYSYGQKKKIEGYNQSS